MTTITVGTIIDKFRIISEAVPREIAEAACKAGGYACRKCTDPAAGWRVYRYQRRWWWGDACGEWCPSFCDEVNPGSPSFREWYLCEPIAELRRPKVRMAWVTDWIGALRLYLDGYSGSQNSAYVNKSDLRVYPSGLMGTPNICGRDVMPFKARRSERDTIEDCMAAVEAELRRQCPDVEFEFARPQEKPIAERPKVRLEWHTTSLCAETLMLMDKTIHIGVAWIQPVIHFSGGSAAVCGCVRVGNGYTREWSYNRSGSAAELRAAVEAELHRQLPDVDFEVVRPAKQPDECNGAGAARCVSEGQPCI